MVSYLFLDGDDLKSGLRALIPHWEPQKKYASFATHFQRNKAINADIST